MKNKLLKLHSAHSMMELFYGSKVIKISRNLTYWIVRVVFNLTHVREHLDTILNRALLDWNQPVTMVDSKNSLQQLHKNRLPGLKRAKAEEWRLKTIIIIQVFSL